MTAAGSSATDALHSLYDQASYAVGYGKGDASQTGSDGGQKVDEDGNVTSASSSDDDNDRPLEGPGNRRAVRARRGKPINTDHDHSEYKPELTEEEDTDTRIDEAHVSAGKARMQDYDGDDDDNNGAQKPRRRQDALERALAVDGPVGQRQGAPIDRALQQDAKARRAAENGLQQKELKLSDEETGKKGKKQEGDQILQNDTAVGAAGDIGLPFQSERNQKTPKKIVRKQLKKLRGHKADSDEDESIEETENYADVGDYDNDSCHEQDAIMAGASKVAAQNPNQKGPAWASRPNDEQREKLAQMAAEQREKRAAESSRARLWRAFSSKKAVQDEVENEQDEGDAEIDAAEAQQAAWHGKSLFRFRLEKRLQEGEELAKQQDKGTTDGEESKDDAPGSSSRAQSSNRLSSLFSAGGTQNSIPSRSRRGTQRSEGPDTKKILGRQSADTTNEQSVPPSPTQQRKSHENLRGDSKMQRISRLMMNGTSRNQHQGQESGTGQGDESGDQGQSGIDGVKVDSKQSPPPSARWSVLRQKLRETSVKRSKANEPKSRIVGQMSIVTELQTGILPVFMLKMALERDEQGHRRIPVFLNHLRLRVSDSVNPLHTNSAIFRLELEYGDNLIRWVCYRSLRDFINLHTHYRAAALKGYLGRSIGSAEGDVGIPKFPKTSLPYITQLQRQGWGRNGENLRAQFAKAQRESLEDYLVELIKRTMFRPEANRLCKFFELSALSVSLAARGGYQGKQGYLRILSRSSRRDVQHGVLTPLHWVASHHPKWFLVRESYIAIVEQPDSLQIFDVFLIDSQFEIIRPKRLYKQTIHFAHELGGSDEKTNDGAFHEKGEKSNGNEVEDLKDMKGEMGKQDESNPSAQHDRKDETALLTEGQWRGEEDEYSGVGNKSKSVSSHTFYVKNSERKLKLVANNERQMNQFIASMERVARRTIFGKENRFGSFAPIRLNCNAQWLVDGRDYFWQVSRALMRAKDRIFIHDWWLSPEVYLRRPGIPKYRLDHILKKKASEGVKVFVIVYNEVSNNFTPTDSNYTKQRLIGLHRNIFVQRSPSHFQTGTFYWAHHEKMCVIDETIAFMGGLDLCFGRWDTPAHVLTDNVHEAVTDAPRNHDSRYSTVKPEHDATLVGPGVQGREFFVWPGQDFANERVMEWYDLTKPDVDLFNRNHYPRMPWHDVGLQLIGQPARDLCRHFTQRWNYLLRIKNHKRLMPFLIPPPDFQPSELEKFDLTGTCEAQICRSAGPWSLGTNNTIEHSIQNAYLKAIQMSDHFVYIENQFFVTSTEVRGTVIENSIGDALVSRIIRAHRERTPWRAVIVIPLIPGFPLPIDHADASSVRLIVELQCRSICRSEHSIYGKLRRRGIDPADYIDFFSLRQWGKLPGGKLTTEQVYIHGKSMVVDDRLALIGSANINERSQRGDRDSELACVVRDTDMIDSTMAGRPYKVGKFAHTLRMRLMREHLGVDVDELDGQAAAADEPPERMLDEEDFWDPNNEQSRVDSDGGQSHIKKQRQADIIGQQARQTLVPMATGTAEQVKTTFGSALNKVASAERSATSNGNANNDDEDAQTGDDTALTLDERLKHISSDTKPEKLSALDDATAAANVPVSGKIVPTAEERHIAEELATGGKIGSTDKNERRRAASTISSADLHRNLTNRMSSNPWAPPANPPTIDADRFADPLDDRFYRDMWMASAVHNTQIYRKVFKSVPDDTVTTWSEYKAFQAWSDRLSRSEPSAGSQEAGSQMINSGKQTSSDDGNDPSKHSKRDNGSDPNIGSGANPSHGHAQKHSAGMPGSSTNNLDQPQQQLLPHTVAGAGYSSGTDDKNSNESSTAPGMQSDTPGGAKQRPATPSKGPTQQPHTGANGAASVGNEGFTSEELEQMERLLETTRGTLVLHSTRFLEAEERSDNLLFNLDRLNPLSVYA